jgi:hypothetical protein
MWNVTGEESLITRKPKKSFYVLRYQTGFKPTLQSNKSGNADWSVYVKSIHDCKIRTDRLVSQILYPLKSKKILIGVLYKNMADRLYEIFRSQGESVSKFYGNMQKYQDARIVIAVIAKMREGVDEKSTAMDFTGRRIDTVIPWVSMKNELTIEQFVGRGFRDERPMVIFPEDDSKIAKRHWGIFKKWAKEKGAEFGEHTEAPVPVPGTYTCHSTGDKLEVTS